MEALWPLLEVVFCYEFYLHPDFLHIYIQSAFVMSHPICIHHQKMTEIQIEDYKIVI